MAKLFLHILSIFLIRAVHDYVIAPDFKYMFAFLAGAASYLYYQRQLSYIFNWSRILNPDRLGNLRELACFAGTFFGGWAVHGLLLPSEGGFRFIWAFLIGGLCFFLSIGFNKSYE